MAVFFAMSVLEQSKTQKNINNRGSEKIPFDKSAGRRKRRINEEMFTQNRPPKGTTQRRISGSSTIDKVLQDKETKQLAFLPPSSFVGANAET